MVSVRLLVFTPLLGLCAGALEGIASVGDTADVGAICSSTRQ